MSPRRCASACSTRHAIQIVPSASFSNTQAEGLEHDLKREEGDRREFEGLLRSARVRLADAGRSELSIESKFDPAYNAAHSLALAALRWHGYRSDKRYIIFQCIPHTLGLGPDVRRVLALCHERRNLAEYEGDLDIDEQLAGDLLDACRTLCDAVMELRPLGSG